MEINFDLSFKTSKQFMTKLLESILLYLLHERGQIPFSFDLFERFLSNKKSEETSIKCFKTLAQIRIAKETHEKICALKQTIKSELSMSKSIVILFGSTPFTARESYQINIPFVDNEGLSPNFINETSTLRKVLLEIITNDQLKLAKELPITNCFILFNRYKPTDNADLTEIRDFKLNKTCKKFIINLRDTSDFEIYQDDLQDICLTEKKSIFQQETETDNWYQSKVFAKGFNDILVNSKSIWN